MHTPTPHRFSGAAGQHNIIICKPELCGHDFNDYSKITPTLGN